MTANLFHCLVWVLLVLLESDLWSCNDKNKTCLHQKKNLLTVSERHLVDQKKILETGVCAKVVTDWQRDFRALGVSLSLDCDKMWLSTTGNHFRWLVINYYLSVMGGWLNVLDKMNVLSFKFHGPHFSFFHLIHRARGKEWRLRQTRNIKLLTVVFSRLYTKVKNVCITVKKRFLFLLLDSVKNFEIKFPTQTKRTLNLMRVIGENKYYFISCLHFLLFP